MSAISYKAKSFVTLDPNFLNYTSTKGMEVPVKIQLGNLANRSTLTKVKNEIIKFINKLSSQRVKN